MQTGTLRDYSPTSNHIKNLQMYLIKNNQEDSMRRIYELNSPETKYNRNLIDGARDTGAVRPSFEVIMFTICK